MKKLITATVSSVLAVCAAFSFAACTSGSGNDGDGDSTGGNPTGATAKLKVIDIELTEEEYAFAVKKENTELLGQINGYIAEWKADGSLSALINSYFDGTATFSYSNPHSSAQSGDFVVATNAYFPPFESYNDSSAFVGIDIEIAHKIAQKLNKTLYIDDMDFDAIIPSVKSGASDIGMAGMTVTDVRLEQVNFATGYYTSSQVITVLESDTSFDNCASAADVESVIAAKNNYKIGSQQGTTGYMYTAGDVDFGYDGFSNVEAKAYNTGALAMMDLKNGRIDAVVIDKQPALMIVGALNK